jgi:hypothetical protein
VLQFARSVPLEERTNGAVCWDPRWLYLDDEQGMQKLAALVSCIEWCSFWESLMMMAFVRSVFVGALTLRRSGLMR